jgi:hypothetical protein
MASLLCHVIAHDIVTVLQWASQCSTGVFVGVALASMPASRTIIALLFLPALRQYHCVRCVGIFALVALDLSPTLHPCCHKHCELASAPSQCNCDTSAYMASSLCSLTLSVVFVAITGAVPQHLGLHVQPILRWWFMPVLRRHPCPRHAGVRARIPLLFAGVALALSPKLHWPLCPHCAGIAPSIAN